MRVLLISLSLGLLALVNGCSTAGGGAYGISAPANYNYGPARHRSHATSVNAEDRVNSYGRDQ